jgi:hypothetical protein
LSINQHIFANFIGNWQITRTFRDNNQAVGVASFSVNDLNLLYYKEELAVSLSPGGCVHEAYQEYYYFYDALMGRIVQKFSHGGVFIALKFRQSPAKTYIANAHHLCGEDVYYGTYVIENEDNFTTIYHVLGPHNDYKIITNYTKVV